MRGPDLERTDLSRKLRRDLTSAEQRLWRVIRNRQLGGLKFVRQMAVGPYVADFACRQKRLIVEIDGATHSSDEELAADARRDAFLRSVGYEILRFRRAGGIGKAGGHRAPAAPPRPLILAFSP